MPTFIVADCTGHGVPGAVLSLMCNVLIRESFTMGQVNTPAEALDYIRDRLINLFKSQSEERMIQDGMDIAFCVLNQDKNQLYFSGGNNSCVIISNGELKVHKGDRQYIGYSDSIVPFTNHVVDLKKGDCIFLYTDGYNDQFGGENFKKFSRKRLHQLLIEVSLLPMQDIRLALESEFDSWKGDAEQVDDVTIFGLRY